MIPRLYYDDTCELCTFLKDVVMRFARGKLNPIPLDFAREIGNMEEFFPEGLPDNFMLRIEDVCYVGNRALLPLLKVVLTRE